MLIHSGPNQKIIIGPFASLNTWNYTGIFGILALLQRIRAYGQEIYWPWLEARLLKPLQERKGIYKYA